MIKRVSPLIALFLLSACSTGIPMAVHAGKAKSPHEFSVCHGFSCTRYTNVKLDDKDWKKVASAFSPRAKNANNEREQITEAISILEKITQAKTGLNPDEGRAHTFEGDQDQMDCIDETINTTHYIGFLKIKGLLHFNEPAPPIHRGYIIDGLWPHNAATVRDLETDAIYAIDSYYEDNGGKTYVVEKDIWLDEWRPAHLDDEIIRTNQLD